MIEKQTRTEYCNNKNGRCILAREAKHNFKPRLYVHFNGLLSNKAHRRRLMRVAQGICEALVDADDDALE